MPSRPLPKTTKRIRITLGFKVVSLITLLLLVALSALTWTCTRFFRYDNASLVRQFNANLASSLASQARVTFESILNSTRGQGRALLKDPNDPAVVQWFSWNPEILAVFLLAQDSGAQARIEARAISPDLSRAPGLIDPDKLVLELDRPLAESGARFSLQAVQAGEAQAGLVSVLPGLTAVAVAFPFVKQSGRVTNTLFCLIKRNFITDLFAGTDGITSYMVDRYGGLVAHSDRPNLQFGESKASSPIVKMLLKGALTNRELRYENPETGEPTLGGARSVGFAGLGVVTEMPEEAVYESSERVTRLAFFLGGIIFFLCLGAGTLFSGAIVTRVNGLVDASMKIAKGDFQPSLSEKGWDEIAHLSRTFNAMAMGLAERDRYRETFHKFHNDEIAEKLLSGEVHLGGERKQALILFTDLRGFTALSGEMEPEQLVETLNEYMTRMVRVIRSRGGMIDKFVGDAIMAVWGVPFAKPDDAANAVAACLEMRAELVRLNESRVARGMPPLQMGMGLNAGAVIAGNIGSEERMEYTLVGDAVNVASRIESSTKEVGTDLLVSEDVKIQVANQFVFEAMPSVLVKGKSEPIAINKVLGFAQINRVA